MVDARRRGSLTRRRRRSSADVLFRGKVGYGRRVDGRGRKRLPLDRRVGAILRRVCRLKGWIRRNVDLRELPRLESRGRVRGRRSAGSTTRLDWKGISGMMVHGARKHPVSDENEKAAHGASRCACVVSATKNRATIYRIILGDGGALWPREVLERV